MDRKSIIVIIVSIALLALLPVISNKLYPPKVVPADSTNLLTSTQSMTLTNVESVATLSATNAPSLPASLAQFITETNLREELLVITNAQARYTFTSRGGGLKSVELVEYAETVQSKNKPQTGHGATLNDEARVPVLAILDGEAVQGDNVFELTPMASGVRAEKQLTNGLQIVKEFTLSSNYMVNATVKLENRSSEKLSLPPQEWVAGMATPMSSDDKGQAVGIMWYDGSKKQEITGGWFANRTLGCLPGTPRAEYQSAQSNAVWVAVHNQFFTLVTMPKEPARQVISRKMDLPAPTAEELRDDPRANKLPEGYETTLLYPALDLQAGQSVQRDFVLYAGPKEYRTLARIAEELNNNVDLVMGYSGFFGFFSKGLLLGMNWLHSALHFGYGWAVIAITVIIKLLFWPLTQASTRSMKRMQALQPQMKAIQAKYKDDPVKMNKKTMEFMKENKVSPLGGCLPMALQMPVFFGFYRMIQSAIELRGASFLWIRDLAKPDTLFMIPGTAIPFNLLPLIMGATMLWQSHLTPPSPGVDPAQQKLMRYMPLIFLFILYNFSSGLTLYWTVNNLLTIAQTKLTKTQPVAAPAPALTPPPKKKK